MFVQVIQGKTHDAAALKAAGDRWIAELSPGSPGWLGTTSGVTDDGTYLAMVRFDSEDAARRNSDRPEQHDWWMETSKLFSGDVTFHDCSEVDLMDGGGSDQAGFVQIMQGRVRDVARVRELQAEISKHPGFRPDVLGGVVGMHGTDGFTMAIYFADEKSAREGEQAEPPAELAPLFEEQMSLMEDMSYFDIRDPWLRSAG
ncbi:MAG: hypothetical protein QOE01_2365 [Actinomycetota bacterium]|jgi:hypothetical protein|nr:hypothetical protein [Actinomycetota bacterium]